MDFACKKSLLPAFGALLFFLTVQWYGIYFMWYNHPGPLGLEDSAGYMSRIAFFREYPFFDAARELLPSHPPYSVNEIAHPYLYGLLARLADVPAETMFHWNFYVGLLLMGIVLFVLFRKIEVSPMFVVPALLLFAFYEGEGSYHGFSWVVPSFYAILLFLISFIALFYSKRPYLAGFPAILLLLLTHSTGLYLAGILMLALFLNDVFSGQAKQGFRKASLLLLFGFAIMLASELLSNSGTLSKSFSTSFQSYQDIIGADGITGGMSWTQAVAFLFERTFETVTRHDFTKYFFGLYTPLVAWGLFRVFRNGRYPLAALFVALLAGQLIAPLLTKLGYRFFYPLEVVTWIIMAYGFAETLKVLRAGNPAAEDNGKSSGRPLAKIFSAWALVALSTLFFYNAVYHKTAHNYQIKFYHPKFFDDRAFIDYVHEHRKKKIVIFCPHLRDYLYLDDLWRFSNILHPDKASPETIAGSPGQYAVIGEAFRLYEEKRHGFSVVLPRDGAILLQNEGMTPGTYRLELNDSGLEDTEGLIVVSGDRKTAEWRSRPYSVRFPDDDAYPPVLLPWYLNAKKTWPLFSRPFRPDDIVRTVPTFTIDLRITENGALLLQNKGGKKFLHGSIRLVNKHTRQEWVLDFDRDNKATLEASAGLLYKGKRHPLLWTDPEISKSYRTAVFRLERNFGDVKAFSWYAGNIEAPETGSVATTR
ncbi:hypothetical protein CHL67_01935 [Prosthecochloris sp. GSB1]|uniref:hypothetical protein n=1 Tax=Prosthecochloris sp. GSB1 TaxID=281093 RepID=UPI000B8CAAEC|nr:hypothetical protein [Prosthecochloris sp. GSB1]ASQ89843.1 hypothetical protein CHL67_01935 [Prosthecochloris sp. GSB1]